MEENKPVNLIKLLNGDTIIGIPVSAELEFLNMTKVYKAIEIFDESGMTNGYIQISKWLPVDLDKIVRIYYQHMVVQVILEKEDAMYKLYTGTLNKHKGKDDYHELLNETDETRMTKQ